MKSISRHFTQKLVTKLKFHVILKLLNLKKQNTMNT